MTSKAPTPRGRLQPCCILALLLTLSLAAGIVSLGRAQSLESGFASPPGDPKPWCYWYWISDNISKEGITRDLEAMARVGIGEAFIGEVLKRVPAADRKAFKRVVADSYEMGSQNWTDGFDAQFRQRYGYDPKPWLPVLSGRLVGSADQSERFLWDLRRLVADRVATDYVGGLREACKPHGLGLWLENYGHWGFPGEFLKYGGESDRIGGEYWVTGDLGSIECRAASSCANTYGRKFVSAEAFTGGPAFQNAPGALKARGDWSFCEGVNHFVLHVTIQQPWADKRPEVLRKIRDLVKAGATVIGLPPSRSPSLENFPRCDAEVRTLTTELWGGANSPGPGERQFGKGRIVWGRSLEDVLASLKSPPDFESSTKLRFTHRRSGSADIYFVANPKPEPLTTTAAFRAGGKAPEFWWPDSGKIERPAVYDAANDVVRLPLSFGPHGSVFVMFRHKAAAKSARIVSVRRNGREVLSTLVMPAAVGESGDSPNNFTFAAWIRPADATPLVREANRGVIGMSEKRNDALAAPHGDGFGGAGHAGSGLAVGTNGVCVFEHGANYFAPTLVHPAPLGDWTHVAVVYLDGQPSLYLNGAPARIGLKSEHIVHSGAGAGGQAQFRGKLGSFTQSSRPLSDRQVAELANTMPRPDPALTGPVIQLTKLGRRLTALVTQPGDYELAFADGKRRKLSVTDVPTPQVLEGPWEVQFAPGWGAPERVTLDPLCDWTQRPEDGIRHYSGKATYRKTFELPGSRLTPPASRFHLDLGEVRDLATVRLNGKELGTLWLAPWRLDITDALKTGKNRLEVDIINVWNNRLVGDAALPAGQRRTFLLAPTVMKDSPLLPAGLMGPVVVQPATEIHVR